MFLGVYLYNGIHMELAAILKL